jgi:hypothetical protein
MAKPNYEEFDRTLLAQIEAGIGTMKRLEWIPELRALAAPHQDGVRTPVYRVIDRRLQALRKAGKLRWSGKVWEIAPK